MSFFRRLICTLVTLATVSGARADMAIQALNPDVSLVTGVENSQTAQAVQADGKLVITGWVELADGAWLNTLRRYTPDGAADPTFDASALQPRWIDQVVALPDGKILVVGRFGPDPNAPINPNDADDDDDDDDEAFVPDPDVLIRLNADGSRDATFQLPALTLAWISAVNVLSDGGLLLSGYHAATTQNEAITPFALVRLTADGQVDASFHGDFPAGVYAESVYVQPDNRIVVVARAGDEWLRSTLLRLNADGSPDSAFHSGLAAGGQIDAVTLLTDGRLLVATHPDGDSGDHGTITRLNGDGSVDPDFALPLSSWVRQMIPLESGAVVALGDVFGSDGSWSSAMELIDPVGSVKTLSDVASPDVFDYIAPLAGGGFAASGAASAADGTPSAFVDTFDGAGMVRSRTAIGVHLYAALLLPRPTGGVYAILSSAPSFCRFVEDPPLLSAGTFSPPPSPGVSIKAGPTVRIEVLRPEGYAGAAKKAKFLLTRDGDLSKDLKVTYQVRGTAVSGRDYLPLRGQKIIKAGRATAKIKVRPIGGRVKSGEASVKLMLVEKRAYSLGAPSVAKVHLLNRRGAKSKP